jgi:hypothetical protein
MPESDEFVDGYNPAEDPNMVFVGDEENRVGNYVDRSLVELPRGGLTKHQYEQVAKFRWADKETKAEAAEAGIAEFDKNGKLISGGLPAEGIATHPTREQRDEAARERIWNEVADQVEGDDAQREAQWKALQSVRPQEVGEADKAYHDRLMAEFSGRLLQDYYDRTVEAGVPLTRPAGFRDQMRTNRYNDIHVENMARREDIEPSEGTRGGRFFRRVVGLGAAALNLRGTLNLFGTTPDRIEEIQRRVKDGE